MESFGLRCGRKAHCRSLGCARDDKFKLASDLGCGLFGWRVLASVAAERRTAGPSAALGMTKVYVGSGLRQWLFGWRVLASVAAERRTAGPSQPLLGTEA